MQSGENAKESQGTRIITPGESPAWATCARLFKNDDDVILERWKDEIDNLLVFAGLFSAVLTAFNVGSYSSLQPNSGDMALMLLVHISSQLGSFSINPTFLNSTQSPVTLSDLQSTFHPTASTIRINALWFSSLVCSLAAASISILVRQWLNQYRSGFTTLNRETARLRHYRHTSLIKWRVTEIIALIPILLQLALVLFLVGLLDLLWNLHRTVAIVTTVFVALLLLFSATTIVLPTFVADCFYQSPQALAFFLAVQGVQRMCGWLLEVVGRLAAALNQANPVQGQAQEVSPTESSSTATHSMVIPPLVRSSLPASSSGTSAEGYHGWQSRENNSISNLAPELDKELLAAADLVDLRNDHMEQSLELCFRDLAPKDVVPCYYAILLHRVYFIEGEKKKYSAVWKHHNTALAADVFFRLTLCVLEQLDSPRDESLAPSLNPHKLYILEIARDLWDDLSGWDTQPPPALPFILTVSKRFLDGEDAVSDTTFDIIVTVSRWEDFGPIVKDFLPVIKKHIGRLSAKKVVGIHKCMQNRHECGVFGGLHPLSQFAQEQVADILSSLQNFFKEGIDDLPQKYMRRSMAQDHTVIPKLQRILTSKSVVSLFDGI
ncbi:hypothetical protein A0H81_07872 [Grifola frondosa]|uniref:DUF6535 domain-containing protein n=1 Tax=Grifola frondosa TaxID=5627 RepID=A0A1C7M6C3_GRIFR|nr:hypothetical protein A0H81_07872 [Grifola frondosa]